MSQMIVKLLISGGQCSEKKIQRSKIYIRSCITFCIMGQKKTPLHVLTGVAVHATSKSASLVKSLNKSGISISYDKVQRHRTRLTLHTIEKCKNTVLIPTHFDPTKFTKAAFDNFDHEECSNSGLGGTHDTVSVLFQNKSKVQKRNPKISDTNVNQNCRTLWIVN